MPNHLLLEPSGKSVLPGETLGGEFLWDLDKEPESLVLRLGWWTEGRGDRDEKIVREQTWDAPARIGKERFSLEVPEAVVPSFSGRLVSVVWALQLSARGIRIDDAVETLTVSPMGREIDLSGNSFESKGKSFSFGKRRGVPLPRRR